MRLVLWILPLLVCCLIAGCGDNRDVDSALLRADEMMETMPDSALKVMEAIDPEKVSSGRQRAEYALLLTQARYKNFIDETDDSLISIAVRHYRHKNNHRALANACFHKARILENAGNDNRSLAFALDAEQAAIKANDNLWLARIYELMADLYDDAYNSEMGIKYRQKAVLFYQKANQVLSKEWAMLDLANSFSNLKTDEGWNKSIEILDRINSEYSKHYVDSFLLRQLCASYIYPYIKLNRLEDAKRHFTMLENFNKQKAISPIEYCLISRVYIEQSKADSAYLYLSMAIESDTLEHNQEWIIETRYMLEAKKGDYKDALEDYLVLSNRQNEIIRDVLRQSLSISESNYHKNRAIKEHRNSKRIKTSFWFAGSIGFTILSLIIVIFVQHTKYKNNQIVERVNEIHDLSKKLNVHEKSNLILSNKINEQNGQLENLNLKLCNQVAANEKISELAKDLFEDHFKTLSILCDEYVEKEKAGEKIKLSIFNSIRKEIYKVIDPKAMSKLENCLNECKDNIVFKFKSQFESMSEKDINFTMLVFANLSPRTVALLSGLTLSSYYTRKRRIKAKIENSNAPDKLLFIENLR